MSLIPLEEYTENHNLAANYLYLLGSVGRLSRQRLPGHIYIDDQIREKMEEEQRFWERAWRSKKIGAG